MKFLCIKIYEFKKKLKITQKTIAIKKGLEKT